MFIEEIYLLNNNIDMRMRDIILLFTLIFLANSVFAKDNTEINESFLELGHYIETLETNDEEEGTEELRNSEEESAFEQNALDDVYERYEQNAVELKLDNENTQVLDKINRTNIFNLRINEDKYNIESSIRNENMIWDSSQSFKSAFFTDTRHMAPIPSVINSSKLVSSDGGISASLGQTNLFDANGPSLLFIRANESTYNTGAVISLKGKFLNLSAGSFSSSYNHASSGGAILSTDYINLPFNAGSFCLGGGYFANEYDRYNKYTGGGFIEYKLKRLKLNAQIGESNYSNTVNYNTSLYFVPEFQLTNSLSLKTRFIRNISQSSMQDELVLTYRPNKNNNNLEFEINTSKLYTPNENINHRIKFSTSFKI